MSDDIPFEKKTPAVRAAIRMKNEMAYNIKHDDEKIHIIVEKEGDDMWCAHDETFTHTKEDGAVFASTPEGAVVMFIIAQRKSLSETSCEMLKNAPLEDEDNIHVMVDDNGDAWCGV